MWPQHDVFIILCFSSYTGPPNRGRLRAPQNKTLPLMVLTAAVLAHPLLGEFSFSSLSF